MFTLSQTPVKFTVLLVLFLFSSAWELAQLARSRSRTDTVGAALHALMALVMLLMVPVSLWRPVSRAVPETVWMAVMAAGAIWFAWQAIRSPHHRRHALGCTVMFVAMAWHLSAMAMMMRHMTMSMASGTPSAMPSMSMGHASMPMDHSGSMPAMPSMSWSQAAAEPGGLLWWYAIIGLPLMVALLGLALRGLQRAMRSPDGRLAGLAGFAMNFGMFWMSTGLLKPVLPWITALNI